MRPLRQIELRPSAASRWIACPSSAVLEASLPVKEVEPSDYALEGTQAHALAEICLTHDTNPRDYVNVMIDEKGVSPFVPTEEMITAVSAYVAVVRATIDQGCDDVAIEQKVTANIDMPQGIAPIGGTADAVVARCLDNLTILDLKYGKGLEVEAENNWQLQIYALAWLEHFEELGYLFDRIRMTIVQPRITQKAKHWFVEDIDAWRLKVKMTLEKAIKDAASKNPTFATGDHCRFCPVKAMCPKIREELMEKANSDFGAIEPDAPKKEIKSTVRQAVADLDSADMVHLYERRHIYNAFFEAIGKELYGRAQRGEQVPRHKLVRSFGNRAWALSDEEMIKKFRGQKLTQDDYLVRKIASPAQIEKILDNHKFFEKYVIREEKGLALVSEKDKREAVTTVDDFSDLGI